MATGTTGRGKSRIVAALLAWLLGAFGVHHFYLGSTMCGVICLFTCGGCGIITLVELIMLAFMMDDAAFDAKYNARTPGSMEFVWTKAE
ncbi:MAG: TM2 domain-containing protein [Planctomycetales bacterium]|nr:TM2 domain-containing protein [Planctomycetales bacterium]